jgi:hypothetical protein
MPKFPGPVRHANPDAPILLLEEQQAAGIGIFDNTTDRDNLPELLRRQGYIALIQGKGYMFTGDTWTDPDDWTPFPGFPGGDKFAVLAKVSDDDFDYDWTETPTFEQANISKWSETTSPKLLFTRSNGTDHTNTPTIANDVLGEIGFRGINSNNTPVDSAKILFTQTNNSDTLIKSKFELFVGTDNGPEVALTANDERVISIPNQTDTPTAVRGGIYADDSDILFFGIS